MNVHNENAQDSLYQDATIFESGHFDENFEHFLILEDPEGTQKISLDSKSYVLGRSPENDIVLRSQSVSREHATIKALKVAQPLRLLFQISDGVVGKGKSTNGITINGELRESWVLVHGDQIVFSSNSKATYQVNPEPYTNSFGIFLEQLHNLAQKELKAGNTIEAESYFHQILILTKQVYGQQHPSIANCLIDLAIVYYAQNLFDKTEEFFLEAITFRKKVLGEEHSDVALALLELAAIYNTQSMYARAEPLFLQALDIKKKLLGTEEHSEIADILVDLAGGYHAQKLYQQAKPLYEQALKIYKRSPQSANLQILAVQKKLVSINKKLRPKWLSPNVLVPIALVVFSGAIIYSFFVSKSDIACIKVLPNDKVQSISGEECRRITN